MPREPSWLPDPSRRAAISERLTASASGLTTTALADMAAKYAWINELEAEYRSWINVLVRNGVDAFVHWFDHGANDADRNIFESAPRPLQRQITLHQTVDLIRSTIDTVEDQVEALMPPEDRGTLRAALLHYSREVAFDAAEVYARAAEMRGAWDARVEAMVVDAVVRGDADETTMSRASTLGWGNPEGLAVVIGDLIGAKETVIRRSASRAGVDVLAASQGEQLVVLLGGSFTGPGDALSAVGGFVDAFGPGPVVVGHVVPDLASAAGSARAALSGRRAVAGWPTAPRPVLASDLLPERALAGDGHARRELARRVHATLFEHGGDLLATLEAFVDAGSIEGTARRLFIHANTVRYRLGRIEDLTGFAPGDTRDAYALRLGLSLGRLLH